MGKIKCRDYNACYNSCLECDILSDKKCDKIIDIDTPKKYVNVERKDHSHMSWNECPTCGRSIGYRPDILDFRCERCGQRILWK